MGGRSFYSFSCFCPIFCSRSVYAAFGPRFFAVTFFIICFLPPSVCPSTSCSVSLRASFSFNFLWLWAPPNFESMTQSTAVRAEGGITGAHSELCHCPPEQTQSQRGRQGEPGRETRNQLVREGWQNDSQCTITLVFRFGPNERSFWTRPCVDISFLFFSLFFSYSCTELPPIETHSCHASLLFPV